MGSDGSGAGVLGSQGLERAGSEQVLAVVPHGLKLPQKQCGPGVPSSFLRSGVARFVVGKHGSGSLQGGRGEVGGRAINSPTDCKFLGGSDSQCLSLWYFL